MYYKKHLVEDILPFWLNNAVDYENGGIYTCLDKKGKIYGTDKSGWFQGRALWTFAKAYNCIDKNPEYLKACKNIYEFIPKLVDTDGRLYFTVTADGRGIQKRRYYFSETFATIGCAEYYKASGDINALIDARKYFDIAYKCFRGEIKLEPKFNAKTTDTKALSPVMIMLSTVQTMRSVDKENFNYYNGIAKEMLNEILNGGFLKENALLECVKKTGEFADTPSGRVVNPGHSMEASWFIMLEGLITGDSEVVERGMNIIDITYPLGLDKKHGGIIAFTDVSGEPPVQLEWDMKLWWPQCETLIATRLAYIISKKQKYLDIYNELLDYVKKYFIDEDHGEWYGYLHYDNTPSTTLKGNIFKGPFHIPRLYMIMAVLDEFGSIDNYV